MTSVLRASLVAFCLLLALIVGRQADAQYSWGWVYEPNTSNNNFKFDNDPRCPRQGGDDPAWCVFHSQSHMAPEGLWSNGNQHLDLNISRLSIHALAPSFAGPIYAHFMPWFNGNHLSPGYRSTDGPTVDNQIEAMRSRGIDGVIVDWYGPPPRSEDAGTLALRDGVRRSGLGSSFVMAIMIDHGALRYPDCDSSGGDNDCTVRMVRYIRDYVVPVYQNLGGSPDPSYMRIGNRPVIFFFGLSGNDDPGINWDLVRAAAGDNLFIQEGAAGFTDSSAKSDGAFSWHTLDRSAYDYLTEWYNRDTGGRISFGSAYKGFNDSPVCWGPAGRECRIDLPPQHCGGTWLEGFRALQEHATVPYALQLLTWNDYEEGTALEIGIDSCLGVVRASLTDADTVGWNLSFGGEGSVQTLDHVTVWARDASSQMFDISGPLDPNTTTFYLPSGQFPGPGDYRIYVQAGGKPFIKNLLSEDQIHYVR